MHECMGFRDISALLRENFVNISLSRFRYCSHTTVPRGREVFWHEYAKIPRHTSQNSIAAGNLE